MGRKPVPEKERKELLTIRLPRYLIEKLRDIENYNNLIEKLLKDYFNKKNG